MKLLYTTYALLVLFLTSAFSWHDARAAGRLEPHYTWSGSGFSSGGGSWSSSGGSGHK